MRSVFALLVVFVLLSGCRSQIDHLDLDERWYPLVSMERDPSLVPQTFGTKGQIVYASDLQDFRSLDGIDQGAVLKHEQIHAARQLAFPGGPTAYLDYYNQSLAFRWEEEKTGWELQIRYWIRYGKDVDAHRVANFLNTGYLCHQTQPMVSYDEAFAWVSETVVKAKKEYGR